MKMNQTIFQRVCMLKPEGRLDATVAPLFRERLAAVADREHLGIVMDFSRVEFIDSSGLGALIGSVRKLRFLNRDIKLASLTEKVRRVFGLTGAHQLFDIYDDPASAAMSFSGETND